MSGWRACSAAGAVALSLAAFLATSHARQAPQAFAPALQLGSVAQPLASAGAVGEQAHGGGTPWAPVVAESGSSGRLGSGCAGLLAAAATLLLRASRSSRRRSARAALKAVALSAEGVEYGEDLSVPDDSFCVLGLAHCFKEVDGKLRDAFVLEPVTGSTVEVIQNGCKTSYVTYVGTTVGDLLKQDTSLFPEALLHGHEEVEFGENLTFRTGCAARTWTREHARDVVRLLAPMGEVKTDFNTDVSSKRILNFVNVVDDSDNVKQDMSIDVYGREEEEAADGADPTKASFDDLYNA